MSGLLKKIKFNHIFWVFFYFFLFSLLLRGSFNYLDPDFGWHLQVGREIAQTHLVPSLNHYNYTFTGSWVDHEWLSNLLTYFIYSHWGYSAVVGAFAWLIILVLILLNVWTRRILPSVSLFTIAFFQTIGVIAAAPHFGVRMQESGLLFLLLLLLILSRYTKRKNWRVLLWLPPLFYLWACLHASFLIGFFLLGAYLAVKIGEKIIARYRLVPRIDIDFSSLLNSREILVFAGAAFLSLAATLFTPYKLGLYSFLAGYKNSFYQAHIQEWLSQFSFPFLYWQLIYLAFLVFALIFYIYYSRPSRQKLFQVNLWTLFLVVLFTVLSFKSRRHFPLMFVATFPFLIEIFSGIFPASLRKKDRRLNRWLKFYLLICLALVTVSQLIQIRFIADPFKSFCVNYPCGAVKFLKDHPAYDSLNLFNDYGWGGYLIWNLPARQLFIDGRLPQVAFASHTFLEEYLDFFKKNGDVGGKLQQYQIRLVLIPAQDKDLKAKKWEKIVFGIKNKDLVAHNYLRDYLRASQDWQPIYNDATAVIYLKKN